ncbi:MAG TPA: nucleoside deaminase [Bacteroidia bacterium]|nr:nucleoside deaminase [Bacteroidia bacterium]
MKQSKLIPVVALLCILLLLALLFQSKWYYLTAKANLTPTERKELVNLAVEALKAKEVPVASLVIYNGKIIGRGYNTVLKDTNIGGHAEINAISDVIKNIGTQKFNSLNRDSLLLITTYEPCLMCRGAISENRIEKVAFIKEKDLGHWIKNEFKSLRYETKKHKVNETTLQDSLFYLHPAYKK